MCSQIKVHILGAMIKGNVGSVAAQRALYDLLLKSNNFDLSVSVSNKKIFKLYNPELKNSQIYDSLNVTLFNTTLRNKAIPAHLQWPIITTLNLPLFLFSALLASVGVKSPFRRSLIERMKKCDIFLDLDLEFFKGVPISMSSAAKKQMPLIFILHKLFWSYRMLYRLFYILIIKSAFKKKIVIGPSSFGPFTELPILTQWVVKFTLNRFVDLIFVREPHSANILDELGVKNYLITTDAALTLKNSYSPSKTCLSTSSKLTIGFAPAKFTNTLTKKEIDGYVMAHVKCINDLVKKYDASIIFLPSSPDDVSMCNLIITKLGDLHNRQIVITDDVSIYETWIRRLNLLITTRMHPSIIAARNFVPFATIIYDHKQLGVLQQLGLQRFSLHINKTSYVALKMLVNEAIENRLLMEKKLETILPKLQQESLNRINYALISMSS